MFWRTAFGVIDSIVAKMLGLPFPTWISSVLLWVSCPNFFFCRMDA